MELQDGFYWARLADGAVEVVEVSKNGIMRTGLQGRYVQCEFQPDFGPNPKPVERPDWLISKL